jgi:replicative DNA helicase
MARKTGYWKKRLALEDDETIKEIEEAVLERGAEVDEDTPADELVHISELADDIKKEYEDWGNIKGLKTGLPSLDQKLGGLGAGHVILIGGETSNGKSALAANIAVNVSRENPVLFITLEMMSTEIGARIMHINGGTLDGLDMIFQKEHRLTYRDIKPLLVKAIEMGSIKMVVLDYLQYLGRGMTEKEVAIMSKEIKTLALEFKLPFIVIVSLRKSEGGRNKRKWTEIEIEDYMGTGAIGYDCDAAIIASRKNMDNEFDDDHLWVKVLKTRNAKLDYQDRYMFFDWDQTRITEDWTKPPEPKPVQQSIGEFDKAIEAGNNAENA